MDTATGTSVMTEVADLVASAAHVAVSVTVWKAETTDGAVYRPLLEMLPTCGEMDQVTPVFELPLTVAVNCCCWPALRLAVPGLIVTAIGGGTVTVELADGAALGRLATRPCAIGVLQPASPDL